MIDSQTGDRCKGVPWYRYRNIPGIFLVSSGAEIRPLSQWDLGDSFPNLKKKFPNLKKKKKKFFFFFF